MSLNCYQTLIISSIFYMNNFVIYKIQIISNAPFEINAPLSLSLIQKEHINVTLDAWVVFTKDSKLQRIQIYEIDN
jgi:16S rRNA A1518/A1519 N6-dimethyltransferase RsmA/KsgA/DIM1 with predicted DNA glycosylase/AP lyase activity